LFYLFVDAIAGHSGEAHEDPLTYYHDTVRRSTS